MLPAPALPPCNLTALPLQPKLLQHSLLILGGCCTQPMIQQYHSHAALCIRPARRPGATLRAGRLRQALYLENLFGVAKISGSGWRFAESRITENLCAIMIVSNKG